MITDNLLQERKESNMKKYEKPIVEIVEFDNLDVIVMSQSVPQSDEEPKGDVLIKEESGKIQDESDAEADSDTSTGTENTSGETEQEAPLEENTTPDTNGTEGDSSASQELPTADEPAPEAPVEPVPETPADPIIPDASEPAVVPEAEADIPVDTGMGVL